MDRQMLEETLASVESFIAEPLDKEGGLRFLLAGSEKCSTKTATYLTRSVSEYHAYISPWIVLRDALKKALEHYDEKEPIVHIPSFAICDLEATTARIAKVVQAVQQLPAIGGVLILD